MRAESEGHKLFIAFPLLIAQSNLFLAVALLEQHLLKLTHLAEDELATLRNIGGSGVDRYFKFLRLQGYRVENVTNFSEVSVAITLRNALLHASGELALSREATRIRDIVAGRLYMDKARRHGGPCMKDEQGRPEVLIIDEHLVVNYHYAFRAAAYCKEFLLDLASRIPAALADG